MVGQLRDLQTGAIVHNDINPDMIQVDIETKSTMLMPSKASFKVTAINPVPTCKFIFIDKRPAATLIIKGLSDPYRDIGYRGGIPFMFAKTFAAMMQFGATDPSTATDYINMMSENPLINEVWSYGANVSSRPEGSTPFFLDVLKDIDIPMLSVGNLNDPDLHLRGNVFAFREAISPDKKLLLYSGTHWGSAYQPWANRTVLRFLDHWLKGIDTGIENEPAVDIQLRTGADTFTHVYGDTWPLERTLLGVHFKGGCRPHCGVARF